MNELKVIENELVPVYTTSTGEKVVYGSELHEVLEVKSRFNDWVRNRLGDIDASEKEDYDTFTKNLVSGGKQKEYIIKLNAAKEMAMLERNEIGKRVRRYFIRVEDKYKEDKKQENIVNKNTSSEERYRIMDMNARSRMAQTYLKIGEISTLSPTYKNVIASKACEILSGEQIIPLPKVEQRKVYTAKEIGDMFGISANMVGRIANRHNLKAEEYGEYRRDKSRHSAHECDTWVYFETVIPEFEKILGKGEE